MSSSRFKVPISVPGHVHHHSSPLIVIPGMHMPIEPYHIIPSTNVFTGGLVMKKDEPHLLSKQEPLKQPKDIEDKKETLFAVENKYPLYHHYIFRDYIPPLWVGFK